MDKKLRILRIMKKKRCDWEEAEMIEKKTKKLSEFY